MLNDFSYGNAPAANQQPQVLFLAIAFLASWLPALRAAGLVPTTALRNE